MKFVTAFLILLAMLVIAGFLLIRMTEKQLAACERAGGDMIRTQHGDVCAKIQIITPTKD